MTRILPRFTLSACGSLASSLRHACRPLQIFCWRLLLIVHNFPGRLVSCGGLPLAFLERVVHIIITLPTVNGAIKAHPPIRINGDFLEITSTIQDEYLAAGAFLLR